MSEDDQLHTLVLTAKYLDNKENYQPILRIETVGDFGDIFL